MKKSNKNLVFTGGVLSAALFLSACTGSGASLDSNVLDVDSGSMQNYEHVQDSDMGVVSEHSGDMMGDMMSDDYTMMEIPGELSEEEKSQYKKNYL